MVRTSPRWALPAAWTTKDSLAKSPAEAASSRGASDACPACVVSERPDHTDGKTCKWHRSCTPLSGARRRKVCRCRGDDHESQRWGFQASQPRVRPRSPGAEVPALQSWVRLVRCTPRFRRGGLAWVTLTRAKSDSASEPCPSCCSLTASPHLLRFGVSHPHDWSLPLHELCWSFPGRRPLSRPFQACRADPPLAHAPVRDLTCRVPAALLAEPA